MSVCKMSNMFLLKHFDGKFPINLEKMMYYEGLIFEKKDIDPYVSIVNSNISSIQISKKIPKEIESFVISYSIGYLLLLEKSKNLKITDIAYSQENKEQNNILNFAMNLIMPETKFRNFLHSNKNINDIKTYFGVSSYLATKRIDQLKIKTSI